eukprot:CAMPEP_0117842474 /NCGR_PEP_ID=MMETSP0949-20121206/16061_1 /TAXON_ID=44440 /ORGANISM="Chattonella subsalsa, Strain CCMP2191" /LENGTH=66 /DNA_ID=CAMNT_0005686579 /DNA_START=308 /DNA_END=508 /DNA_ORIENTATION=+
MPNNVQGKAYLNSPRISSEMRNSSSEALSFVINVCEGIPAPYPDPNAEVREEDPPGLIDENMLPPP